MIISGISVISPYGIGYREFASGVHDGRCALSVTEFDEPWAYPFTRPHPCTAAVPDFDIRAVLDDKSININRLGRPAGLAMGAVGMLLRDNDLSGYEPRDRGIVLGGALVTADRSASIMQESVTSAAPYYVDPKLLPGSAMNYLASQCAIRFGLKGLNSTVTAGRTTGLSILNYARRAHASGRAGVLLAGAAEDLNPQRCWLIRHGRADAQPLLGEGCCVFLTESRESAAEHGRPELIEVLGLEFGVAVEEGSAAEVLASRIGKALKSADLASDDVWAAAISGLRGTGGADELAAVNMALGSPRVLTNEHLIGDTDGASACFQLLGAVAGATGSGEILLVTSIDPDGQVGCGLFRINARPDAGTSSTNP